MAKKVIRLTMMNQKRSSETLGKNSYPLVASFRLAPTLLE